MRKEALDELSIRISPSAPTDNRRVQMRFVNSTASVIRPERLSIMTKSFPPPAIFEKVMSFNSPAG